MRSSHLFTDPTDTRRAGTYAVSHLFVQAVMAIRDKRPKFSHNEASFAYFLSDSIIMSDQDLQALEHKIDELITEYRRLEQEKRLLQAEREAWKAERAKLIKQNELARSRVEAMIERLKTMEQSHD